MSIINDKWLVLKRAGLDLGSSIEPENNAGSGGRVQRYQRGSIYYHPNTGPYEIHGGILNAYLAQGGPGFNPKTGRRELGYPKSDEQRTDDEAYPRNLFEWGVIEWVSGIGAAVVHGEIYQYWQSLDGEVGPLGHPLSNHIDLAEGEIVFFERGCIYQGSSTSNRPIHFLFSLPKLGQPKIVGISSEPCILYNALSFNHPDWLTVAQAQALRINLQTALSDRFGLVPVNMPTVLPIPLSPVLKPTGWNLETPKDIALQERTLYNIVLALPGSKNYVLSPHSLYVRRDWSSFSLMHATDLHVSRRLEGLRSKLERLAATNPKMKQAAENYINYNDGLRAIITYANRLYKRGELDAILATGDLIDYIFEEDDHQLGSGNWGFLEKLLRGQVPQADGSKGEELLVPIFMGAGNHDYRLNPYQFLFNVDIPAWPDEELGNYQPHNLTKEETKILQGGKPTIDRHKAYGMVKVDQKNPTFFRRFVNDPSYIVELGPHRIVMIDSRWDAGILDSDWDVIKEKAGFGEPDNRNFAAGDPNSEGFTKADVELVKKALVQAGGTGLVIVGVHAPPLNIACNDYPHFLRETERPSADLDEIIKFIKHRAYWISPALFYLMQKVVKQNHLPIHLPVIITTDGFLKDWLTKGSKYFKKGNNQGLDYGIARGETKDFLEACVGADNHRPVDLVLSGHVHRNVEFRVGRDSDGALLYYTDFYTETPNAYYPTLKLKEVISSDRERVVPTHKIFIKVKPGAPLNQEPSDIHDHRPGIEEPYQVLEVPPYADPLETTSNPSTWWHKHRPLLLQTASTGPMDRIQRVEEVHTKLDPSFRGVRLIRITNNVISKVKYVTLKSLNTGLEIGDWGSAASGSVGG